MHMMQAIKLQIMNAFLMLVKYGLIIAVGYLVGMGLEYIPNMVEETKQYITMSLPNAMAISVLVSSMLGNIFAKSS